MKVVVVGQGYVGLPLAVRAAQVGHHVVAYDIDENRMKRLLTADSYIEDITDEVLSAILASGAFHPSSDAGACEDFDVAIIAVPTPLREGVPDLRYIEESAQTLARYLRTGATVIVESTTYPGTTQELVAPILEDGSGLMAGSDFHLGFSPERIDPGNATWTLVNTPKIVSGVDGASLASVQAFYDTIVDTTIPVASPREAELAKLLENTFRHVNIALVNEVAIFAHELGIDVWEAIDAAATKPFGFMRFTPGPGVGGHCLPIDPSYLSWCVERTLGHSFRFVELANDINEHMPDHVVRRVALALNDQKRSVNGSRILLLGLSYKKNTGDARESPAVRVAQLLAGMGAEVRGADPHVVETTSVDGLLTRVEVTPAELAAADAVVLLTDHDAFEYDAVVEHASLVLDCRHRVRGPRVEHL
ncbi:nucleotide sugar dehydrogenase [Mycolicibacterium vaccae]|jgi:UDP-N-acetyl-D-glucosamine dehydrogenase|uniref:Putative UDP-glucose/GDP-mannose dehydrogenase n=1 Tax=Mycolicibacterium vaccae ATCC 25954 TaxID=1194972 RepID=K0UWK8_MYCVA|nr:nucleotide sugar dehydrogenase [Mycolicibacterium vaccae]ANI41946.1 UDP-N-acetyl-D-glucosamine dehydrogenase [Mycolicibacterium vaccae 95051]EJZ06963.1 putative UDP-glucose/GDP-mannose dehydrogenase [Mycolicibacterium vaccae ATCC 25954]